MATDFTKTSYVGVGYRLVYTAMSDGFVSLRVVSPDGEIIQIKNADSYNTSRVLGLVTNGLTTDIALNNNQISQNNQAITEQQNIINNPSSTAEQKAAAQRAINNYTSENGVLQEANAQYNQVINYLQTTGPSDFASVVQQARNAVEPSPNPPTPTVTTAPVGNAAATTTSTNTLAGPASDDSGTAQTTTNGTPSVGTNPATTATSTGPSDPPSGNAVDDQRDTGGASTTGIGVPGDPPYENESFVKQQMDSTRPGRRQYNPLSYLASYTYQISLYMISPDAYEAFVASGKKDIFAFNNNVATSESAADAGDRAKGGIFLVAQSAGMGSPDNRAPGFEVDYYIDNLSFKSYVSSVETGGPVAATDISFTIVEPYGFSFITRLRNAQAEVNKNMGNPPTENPTRQFYILGTRFFGWDQAGNQLMGDEIFDGQPLDPNANGTGALFESYFDIVIREVKFKLDGRATTYAVKGASTAISNTVNITKGMIPDSKTAQGRTVREMLVGPEGLITKLNNDQQKLVPKSAEYPITYKIKWLGNDAEAIAISSVVTENYLQKSNHPASNARTTTQSNDSTAVNSAPNKNATTMTIPAVPITQGIEQIIVRSKYLNDALTKNYKDDAEIDPDTNEPDSTKGSNKKMTWFNISPEISNIKWDKKRNDWVYDITYVIQPYLTPVVNNPYVANTTSYYGPHKRYDYWYTGKNTEILAYEQTLDNAYFNVLLSDPGESDGNETGNDSKNPGQAAPNAINMQTGGDKNTSSGTSALAAINSFRTSIYDPRNFATAKIQILGDPDYLMSDTVGQSMSKFYGMDGYTINPTGGQVFIEIDFKEAVDYTYTGENQTFNDRGQGVTGAPGTMSINDSIEFWRYPDQSLYDRVKGLSYLVTQVVSSFQGGSFKQNIVAKINVLGGEEALSDDAREELNSEEQEAAEVLDPSVTTDSAAADAGAPSTAPIEPPS